MSYYLTKEQLKATLNIGKSVEQWLGTYVEYEDIIIKWVRVYSDKEGFHVIYIECYDQGDEDYLDIVTFTVVDPDEPYGLLNTFSNSEEAIKFAIDEYQALEDKFVSNGMIQEEYTKHLLTRD